MAFFNRIFSTSVRNLSTHLRKRRTAMTNPKIIPFTIAVEGNIGSGKTTFLQQFINNPDICVLDEPVNMWRDCCGENLLNNLYEDPKKWMFTFQSYVQLTMTMQHMKETKKPIKFMERSLFSARHIFVENAIRQEILEKPSAAVIHEWFKWIKSTHKINIDLIVYLRTSPEVAYQRMLARNRQEENKVSLQYLQNLHDLHEEWLIEKKNLDANTAVMVVNGNDQINERNNPYLKYKTMILEKAFQENVAYSF